MNVRYEQQDAHEFLVAMLDGVSLHARARGVDARAFASDLVLVQACILTAPIPLLLSFYTTRTYTFCQTHTGMADAVARLDRHDAVHTGTCGEASM